MQVDAGLVPLEHIQTQQHVDVLALHDGEGAGQLVVADLDGGAVDAAEDAGGADALGHAGPAVVDQVGDVAAVGAGGGDDGRLGARVDEGFDGDPVDEEGHIEHGHAAEHWVRIELAGRSVLGRSGVLRVQREGYTSLASGPGNRNARSGLFSMMSSSSSWIFCLRICSKIAFWPDSLISPSACAGFSLRSIFARLNPCARPAACSAG